MNTMRTVTSLLWAAGSTAGAYIGTSQAVQRFPEAGFAQNPTGQFGWYLVGFALTVGLAIAIAQLLLLAMIVRVRLFQWLLGLILWIPATSTGIAAMILPLWWWDASTLTSMPWLAPIPLLPGTLLLAFMQKLLLGEWAGHGYQWVARSLVGLVVGALVGLVFAISSPGSIEIAWSTVTVFFLTIVQGGILAQTLPRSLPASD